MRKKIQETHTHNYGFSRLKKMLIVETYDNTRYVFRIKNPETNHPVAVFSHRYYPDEERRNKSNHTLPKKVILYIENNYSEIKYGKGYAVSGAVLNEYYFQGGGPVLRE